MTLAFLMNRIKILAKIKIWLNLVHQYIKATFELLKLAYKKGIYYGLLLSDTLSLVLFLIYTLKIMHSNVCLLLEKLILSKILFSKIAFLVLCIILEIYWSIFKQTVDFSCFNYSI